MHQLFATVVRPLLTAVNPRTVLEVGAGQGRLTRWLVAHSQATVHAVDPAPSFDPDLIAHGNGRLVVHASRSVDALDSVPAVDLAILDGDPNWYTVISELRLLTENALKRESPAPVIVVHNLDWPFGRRDGYYDPEAIPEAWRSPNVALGLVPGEPAPSQQGLALVPFVGLQDRLPSSGVRTALEDFLAETSHGWRFVELPGLHGTGVLASPDRLHAHPKLGRVLDQFERPEFLASHLEIVERERVEAMLSAPQSGFEGERVDALQARLELLERDRDGRLREATTQLRRLEQASIESRVRLEVAESARDQGADELRIARSRLNDLERALGEATAKADTLAVERERHDRSATEQQAALRTAREQVEQLEAEVGQLRRAVSTLLEERSMLAEYADRAARSYAWRIGHRLTSIARLLTFRRSRGTSAIARLQERLASKRLELPPGPSRDPLDDGSADS